MLLNMAVTVVTLYAMSTARYVTRSNSWSSGKLFASYPTVHPSSRSSSPAPVNGTKTSSSHSLLPAVTVHMTPSTANVSVVCSTAPSVTKLDRPTRPQLGINALEKVSTSTPLTDRAPSSPSTVRNSTSTTPFSRSAMSAIVPSSATTSMASSNPRCTSHDACTTAPSSASTKHTTRVSVYML